MKIAVAGKGGAGKTTVQEIEAKGRTVLGEHEIVVVPEDPVIARADAEGVAPIDLDDGAPGVRAIIAIADRLGSAGVLQAA